MSSRTVRRKGFAARPRSWRQNESSERVYAVRVEAFRALMRLNATEYDAQRQMAAMRRRSR